MPFLHENLIPGKFRVLPQPVFSDFTLAEVARAQIRAALHEKFLYLRKRCLGTSKTSQNCRGVPVTLRRHDTRQASAVDVCCPKSSVYVE
jgi:hypothetical protein